MAEAEKHKHETWDEYWMAGITMGGNTYHPSSPFELSDIVTCATGVYQNPEAEDEENGMYLIKLNAKDQTKLIQEGELTLKVGSYQIYIDAGEAAATTEDEEAE